MPSDVEARVLKSYSKCIASVAEDMRYMTNTKKQNSIGGFEDKVGPKLIPQ